MQTVIKLCINRNLGKVRLTRINQPALNHLPAVVYLKIKPALHKHVYFAAAYFYTGVIDQAPPRL